MECLWLSDGRLREAGGAFILNFINDLTKVSHLKHTLLTSYALDV